MRKKILYGKLKSWKQVCRESGKVLKIGNDVEVWHPGGRFLQVKNYSIENIFGQIVSATVKTKLGGRKIYNVGRNVIDKMYGKIKYLELKKEMTAYDYWFEWLDENHQYLPNDLFEI